MIVVTACKSPDIDGVACSIAYAELLNKTGFSAEAVYFGDIGLETDFVKNYTKSFPIKKYTGKYDSDCDFVLVDTVDPDTLDPNILLEKVKEIFDHREAFFLEKFINAKRHIELVGSCATLIAEKFKEKNVIPSVNSAIYLYSAIVSNTINFKNLVTTQRDIKMADWLKEIGGLDDKYVEQIFRAKSNITNKNFYDVLFQDLALKTIGNKKVGIAQLEMVDVERVLGDLNNVLIKSLNRIKDDNKLDYLLFTGIDIIKGFNIFYVIDEESQKLFSKVLGIPNLESGYKTDFIIMRKEIFPKLKMFLS